MPLLYVKGEFVGGCDIVREMFQTGELQELLKLLRRWPDQRQPLAEKAGTLRAGL